VEHEAGPFWVRYGETCRNICCDEQVYDGDQFEHYILQRHYDPQKNLVNSGDWFRRCGRVISTDTAITLAKNRTHHTPPGGLPGIETLPLVYTYMGQEGLGCLISSVKGKPRAFSIEQRKGFLRRGADVDAVLTIPPRNNTPAGSYSLPRDTAPMKDADS
jgi:hypothetical protein